MRIANVCVIGLLLSMVVVSAPRAGIDAGNGEIGFDFGVTAWDDNLAGRTGGLLKLRGGYLVSRWFEIEGQIGYSAHSDETDLRSDHGFHADQEMAQYFVSGVFNFHSKGGNIVPYLLAGAGWTDVSFPLSDGEDGSVAWQTAGGSRFYFGEDDHIAFRVEVAFIFDDAFEQSNRHASYAVGFAWRLGEP